MHNLNNKRMKIEDKQSERFQLTINNPLSTGLTHQSIKNILINNFKTVSYFCMADEKGSTYHTHIFVCFTSRVRFGTIKKQFPTAHIEIVKGSIADNINYIKKEGKWEDTDKSETRIPDTFEEFGNRPPESKGKNNGLSELYQMILDGMTNAEIIATNQDYILQLNIIDTIRTTVLVEKYKNTRRTDLKCTYIYGATGTGKTRGVLDEYGDANVYRVTDYMHPFDGYKCQEIILFDEFRESLRLKDMLNYLDVYPIELPSRYANKFACYNKIFIISNWSLEAQYRNEHYHDNASWLAFLRRINDVKVYDSDGSIIEYKSVEEYLNRQEKFKFLENGEKTPFDK